MDKQIIPILTYGCSVWSIPQNTNMIYIDYVPSNVEPKQFIDKEIVASLGSAIALNSVKHIGKTKMHNNVQYKRLLVCTQSLEDKETLLYSTTLTNINITDCDLTTPWPEVEKLHAKLCKRILNVSQKSSSKACLAELGRYPIHINCWTQAIKYWLRLEHDCKNILLKEAYSEAKQLNHWWVQGIHNILHKHGFRDISQNCSKVNNKTFPPLFNQRLKDCYQQSWYNLSSSPDHLSILKTFKDGNYTISPYLDAIKNPRIRSIFTKLRISSSNLAYSTIRNNIGVEQLCSHCNVVDDLFHFLFSCNKCTNIRNDFNIASKIKGFDHKSKVEKMSYLMNPICTTSEKEVALLCKYIDNMYNILTM